MGFAPAVLIEGVGRSAAEVSCFAIVVDLPGGARVSLTVRIPGSCRPWFRQIVAQHSGLMSPGIPI